MPKWKDFLRNPVGTVSHILEQGNIIHDNKSAPVPAMPTPPVVNVNTKPEDEATKSSTREEAFIKEEPTIFAGGAENCEGLHGNLESEQADYTHLG